MEFINARMEKMASDEVAKLPIYSIAGVRVWAATDIARLFHIQSLRSYTTKFNDDERANMYIPTKLGHRSATVLYEKGVHRLLRTVVKNPDNYRFYFKYFNYDPNPPNSAPLGVKQPSSLIALMTVFPDAVLDYNHDAFGRIDMWIPSRTIGLHRENIHLNDVITYNIYKNYTRKIFSVIHTILTTKFERYTPKEEQEPKEPKAQKEPKEPKEEQESAHGGAPEAGPPGAGKDL
jgi:hypothetical protein